MLVSNSGNSMQISCVVAQSLISNVMTRFDGYCVSSCRQSGRSSIELTSTGQPIVKREERNRMQNITLMGTFQTGI
jgi:4-hydroxy-3-methylbut-2-en-1-yl diphosphate synthase IspG/GcpE